MNLNSSCIQKIADHPNFLKISFHLNSSCGTSEEMVTIAAESEIEYTNSLKWSGQNVNYINAKPVQFSCNYQTQYEISSSLAVEKACSCDFGTPATGVDCETGGSEVCISCETGYHLHQLTCAENLCTVC